MYVQIARQATWGGPPLWPVAVGLVGWSPHPARSDSPRERCSPGGSPRRWSRSPSFVAGSSESDAANSVNDREHLHEQARPRCWCQPLCRPHDVDVGVFYRVPLDVPIAQVMFMGGIAGGRRSACSPCCTEARVPGVRGLSFAAAVADRAGSRRRRVRGGRVGDRVRPDREAELTRGRLGHPRAARRGRRPPGTVHPGLRQAPGSRCASTRRSAPTWTPSRRPCARWPPRSRGCRARRSAPSRCRTALPSTAAPSPGHRRCTSSP